MEFLSGGVARNRGAFAEMNPGTPVNMEESLMWMMFTAIRGREAVVYLLATSLCMRLVYMWRTPSIDLDPSMLPPTYRICIPVSLV